MQPPTDRIVSALVFDHLDVVSEELANGVDPNGTVPLSEDGTEREPLLFRASRVTHAPDAVELLLRHGAVADARNEAGDTLLIDLASSGSQHLDRIAVMRRLIEAGVDVNATGGDGLTALDRAIHMTHTMLQHPRASRNWDSPDLVVSLFVLELLEANGARARKHDSVVKRSEIRAMAAADRRVVPGSPQRG